MNTKIPTNVNAAITLFAEAYSQMLEDWIKRAQEVGKLLLALIAAHPNFKAELREAHPVISARAINMLEAVGRGQVLPEIAYGVPSAGRAALSRLQVSDQSRLLKEGVEVVLLRNGKAEILRIEIDNLTPEQVRQVFDHGCLRSEGAQRAWLEDKVSKVLPVAVDRDYVIKGHTVQFLKPCKVSFSALAQILAQRPD